MFADCRAGARQSREAPKPKAINLKRKILLYLKYLENRIFLFQSPRGARALKKGFKRKL